MMLIILAAWLHPMTVQRAGAQTESRPAYRITATIDQERATVDVRQSIMFANRTGVPLSSVVLRLPAAASARVSGLTVSASQQSGPARVEGAIIEVPLDPAIKPGEETRVLLEFTVGLPRSTGRLSITPSSVVLGNWFATLNVHRGDWDRRPYTEVGDAFFTDVADFDVEVDTLRPVELAFTGVLTRREGTRWWFQAHNVRDAAIVGSNRWSIAERTSGSTRITAYAISSSADQLAAVSAEMLDWFSARFGTYPYAELRVVEVDLPATFGGMEYPGLVMLSSRFGALSRGSEYESLVAHEIAHQWFYSWLGNDQIEDPWLDEGLATLAPVLFYLDVAPPVGSAQRQRTEAARPRMPIDSSIYAFTSDDPYFAAIYRPSARLFLELRQAMGAEVFDAAIRESLTVFGHRTAAPRAFLDLLQRRTATNLNPIASRYVQYGAVQVPRPLDWSATLSEGPIVDGSSITINAAVPIGQAEVWLDSQRVAWAELGGLSSATLRLQLIAPGSGERVLLTRIWTMDGTQFETAARVTLISP